MRAALAPFVLALAACSPDEGRATSDAGLELDAGITPACSQQQCSRFAQCTDRGDGTATCICPTGYLGARCTDCAPGYQDRNGDGSCEVACSAAACPVRGSCDDSTGSIVCRCDPGYVLTGTDCVSDGTVPVPSGRAATVPLGSP